MNRKLQEEVVRLKLERRRMMNKERNRKRKRQKVLERRQKRRDWIMEQIEQHDEGASGARLLEEEAAL